MSKHKLIYNLLFIIFFLLITIYLIYNIVLLKNIENFLRYLIIIFLILIYVFMIIIINKIKKKKYYILITTLSLFYIIFSVIIGFNINKVYTKIDKISIKYNVRSMSIVTLNNNDSTNYKIGILKNDMDIFNTIKKKYHLNNETVETNNYIDSLDSLYNNEVGYILLPSNYIKMFSNLEKYENIASETKIIYKENNKIKIENNNNKIDKPFSVLVMGVDSSNEDIMNSAFNGDALLLLTFNPNDFNTTILSIPRDTYIPISCFSDNRKNKIAHAAWYGEDCMIDTINSLFAIDIDYYVKIDFKGFVELIDLLGGIEVDVPIEFCEQDSNRDFNNMICLEKGKQVLNGEQALALSRHRKTINDFVRGDNQQLLIKSIIEKIKEINDLNTVFDILNTISNNMITNMSTNEILSLYNIMKEFKNKNILDNFNKLSIKGYSDYIYDYSLLNNEGMKLLLYEFIPYEESIEEISKIMQDNLNIEYTSINYDEPLDLLPNFIGQNESTVIDYGNKYNIPISVEYVMSEDTKDFVGKVIYQSISEGMDIEYINDDGLQIKVVEKIVTKEDKNINCSLEKNKNNNSCKIPNFINKDISVFNIWLKENNYSYLVEIKKISKKDKSYDENKKGLIISQNYINKNIYDLIGKKIIISYIEK